MGHGFLYMLPDVKLHISFSAIPVTAPLVEGQAEDWPLPRFRISAHCGLVALSS
jgi:hypothetical protein